MIELILGSLSFIFMILWVWTVMNVDWVAKESKQTNELLREVGKLLMHIEANQRKKGLTL